MSGRVVALSGGVGGAKLALGLAGVLDPGRLVVVANTGDDFRHLGLAISPDIDTLVYTLAGLADPVQGWGRRDESWNFMTAFGQLGGETWFRLGDADLAMHVARTCRLAAGESLSAITRDIGRHLGIASAIVPMSDDPVRTRLCTDAGWLEFQDYFVRRRCEPRVSQIVHDGAEAAAPAADFMKALAAADLRAVVICPSNPFLSVAPILALPGVRAALRACRAPVLAVSPLVGGAAVKGPTAKIMAELGLEVSNDTVLRSYAGLVDALVVDVSDAPARQDAGGVEIVVAPTLMRDAESRAALACAVLAAADRIGRRLLRPRAEAAMR